MEAMLTFIFAIIYLVPTIVSIGKPHGKWVFLLNLFLGWTIFGWIAAYLWGLQE